MLPHMFPHVTPHVPLNFEAFYKEIDMFPIQHVSPHVPTCSPHMLPLDIEAFYKEIDMFPHVTPVFH